MKTNSLWKLHYRNICCHTTDARLHTRLLSMAGAFLANVYFRNQKRIAWDIDIPSDKIKIAEKLLGVKCATGDVCTDVR
jgi:hypothetical protein